ncbi:hypothetical protein LZ31DRAFT_89067 [Colletotrichum somersetense]|nr:hypothetical protein LZ31DRAFT_89067 [Colletotrichum somersetense]
MAGLEREGGESSLSCTPRIESAVATQKSCRRSFPQKEREFAFSSFRRGNENNERREYEQGQYTHISESAASFLGEKRGWSSDQGSSRKEESFVSPMRRASFSRPYLDAVSSGASCRRIDASAQLWMGWRRTRPCEMGRPGEECRRSEGEETREGETSRGRRATHKQSTVTGGPSGLFV